MSGPPEALIAWTVSPNLFLQLSMTDGWLDEYGANRAFYDQDFFYRECGSRKQSRHKSTTSGCSERKLSDSGLGTADGSCHSKAVDLSIEGCNVAGRHTGHISFSVWP